MWLYRLNHWAGPLVGLYWRLGLEGDVRGVPADGPLIVCGNHSSFLDPWLIGMAFPRPVRYLITHRWYYRSPVWSGFFRAFGTIPVKERDPRGTIRQLCEHLGEGEVIGMFPEGKISHDGRIQKLQSGVARLAANSGAPVLPVGIRGGFESLPRHRRFPRPSRVRIVVGETIRFPGSPLERPGREDIESFNAELVRQLINLSGKPAQRSESAAEHA
jgi:1-acyl-sn-glycerol-3-phosphate acyltransferase